MENEQKEFAYWMALSHLKKMRTVRKNEIIVKIHDANTNITDFFNSDIIDWKTKYSLQENEIELLKNVKNEISSYSFLVENLLNQGYDIIPINSSEYPATMKENLKMKYSPPLIYVKGNKKILKETSIAIVGSRNATNISLEFTNNIAKKASEYYKVVVSGFAKGVDRQGLDSAINFKGQSIIVLPQGITTFNSRKYHKQIINGDVLVLSTFHPKAPWSVQFAMARNPIIYGLAKDIFVAESSNKGGTWSGVKDGLRKGRKIFVRAPEDSEKNANSILIQKGAIPVDMDGNEIQNYSKKGNTKYQIPGNIQQHLFEPSE